VSYIVLPDLYQEYLAALRGYLEDGSEVSLLRAYEIGRGAIKDGLGMLTLTQAHQDALASLLSSPSSREERTLIARQAGQFLSESLSAFEMAQRGYKETNAALLGLKEELERRAAELAALNRELELEVSERKQAEEFVRHAKEEAEEANRAKSDFLSRMSHELRTPLNAVLGFGQLLEMESLKSEQAENVQQILKAGQHLLDLITEVLDLSRIEAGRMDLSIEPVEMTEVVQETLDLVKSMAAKGHVQLRKIPGQGEQLVLADRQRLKQVLLNFLSNAIKYNREGGVATLAWGESRPGVIRLTVSDTGPGISAERIDRLFRPFERLGAEQSHVEGTGLGLALSKRLVEAMKGTIGVESTPDQGSTFFIELPSADASTSSRESKQNLVGAAPEQLQKPATLLYVEDNLLNLKLVERILSRWPNLKLIPALQGSVALDLVREQHPDLILLDLNLPDMPGEEVLRRLKEEADTARIPVVVITADATPGRLERLLAAGARAYVTKPLDVGRFLAIVGQSLSEQ
jgi:signal transduction histidine kinase/ActR/RegA family two-component response regulator